MTAQTNFAFPSQGAVDCFVLTKRSISTPSVDHEQGSILSQSIASHEVIIVSDDQTHCQIDCLRGSGGLFGR
eukprot:scaffold1123_cov168-Amphora_coffeaeformis.AAC.33